MKFSKILIKGFKKFKELNIEFNDHLSVLVGENEVGKSTVLTAIDIVLNQSIFFYNENSLQRYINLELVEKFFNDKSIESLPKIEIELFLNLSDDIKYADFCGLHYSDSVDKIETGIKFIYEFDSDFISDVNLQEFADNRIIPTDYYKATWNTFQGKSYRRRMSPIKMIYLDNSAIKHDIFGNYARQIYNASITQKDHRDITSSFKQRLSVFRKDFEDVLTIRNDQKFGLDATKTDILKLLDIYESGISIQDMGKGKENLVRTEMALNNDIFDLVLIDEPESHLSHTRTRQLIESIKSISQGQIVIASHSSLIVNRLNLTNTIVISKHQTKSLGSLDSETAKYFEKIDNLDVLRFILAKKVILVEGAAEYIILPKLFEIVEKCNIDQCEIDIISMGSISHERYRELAKILNKKIAVITDNDKKKFTFEDDGAFNIYADSSISNWTLEVAFYNKNIEFFDEYYSDKRTEAVYKGESVPKAQAYMLKNKTNNALVIEENLEQLNIPMYLKEAMSWIKQ